MKHTLFRFLLAVIAIITGMLAAFAVAFFPGKELIIFAIVFVVAAVLAWQMNASIDAHVEDVYKKRFPNNPDVLEEPEKTEDKTE